MASLNAPFTSDKRYYTDKDGNVVSEDDPTRQTLLVGKGGIIPAEKAAQYGLPKDFGGEAATGTPEPKVTQPRRPLGDQEQAEANREAEEDKEKEGEATKEIKDTKAAAVAPPETKAVRPTDAGVQDKGGVAVAGAATVSHHKPGPKGH